MDLKNNHSTIKHLDNDYIVCGIFIDLQKAFDTVNHDILLAQLDHYGIRGLANSWSSSFIKNRTQYVYLDGHCSITEQVTCGVPQGSTLGPVLFLVYINDLQGAFSKSKIHHFADDTNLFPAKKLGIIELHSHAKYLGIRIDEVLSWSKQIESIYIKLGRANGILSKLRHFVPKDICISVYYSLFYTHLIYGCLIWFYSRKSNTDRKIKLQKSTFELLIFLTLIPTLILSILN